MDLLSYEDRSFFVRDLSVTATSIRLWNSARDSRGRSRSGMCLDLTVQMTIGLADTATVSVSLCGPLSQTRHREGPCPRVCTFAISSLEAEMGPRQVRRVDLCALEQARRPGVTRVG